MNTSTTQLHKLRAAALLVGIVAFSACEKETENICGGTPSIDNVTLPTQRDTTVTSGNLADWVIIKGNNFCGVSQVLFNDVEASLTDAYITPTEITLRIPRSVPKEVSDKVTVITSGGSAEQAYKVSIPSLIVTGLSNEYAKAGQTAAVVGQNFDLYGVTPETGKVLWAGTPVTITKTTADSVYFVVPANAAPGATLKVVDANNVEKAVPGRYKDNRNMLFSYDQGGSVWGGDKYITEAAVPGAIDGKYIRVAESIKEWTWTEFSTSNTLSLPSDVKANPSKYLLKFEVNTLKPFGSNAIKFVIDGDANTYEWRPQPTFHTRGQWSTRSIKLSDILKTSPDPMKTQLEFKFVFHGPGNLDADISFDNFRIVPMD